MSESPDSRWRGTVDEKLVGIYSRLDALTVQLERLIENMAVEKRVAHHDLNIKMERMEDRLRSLEDSRAKLIGISAVIAFAISMGLEALRRYVEH